MNMTNNEFATMLKGKMEELNLLRANEEFIVDCINDIDVARIRMTGVEGSDVSLSIRLENIQKSVNKNGWDSVLTAVDEALDQMRKKAGGFQNKIDRIEDYEKIKDELIVRPLHYGKDFIQNNEKAPCLYTKKGDIALVLYLVMSDTDGILNTIKVPFKVVAGWKKQIIGLTDLDIFTAAMENTVKRQTPVAYDNIFDISSTSGIKILTTTKKFKPDGINLITTNRKTNGAIAMFMPGVKEKLAEMYDDSFYVAFTSIHEAMIHKYGSVEPISIKRNVTETNRIFGPDETLSNEIFLYNKDTKEFTTVNC